MALSEVIELTREMRDRIVQRWPEQGEGRIKMGAQLIVYQGQAAVFYRDGKSLDTFGPGRHTLTTANVPILTKLLSQLGFGANSIFSAVVYYVALREFPQEGWGTRQPIAMQTPGQGLGWLLLGAHGTFGFEVQEAKRVVDTFVGGGQEALDLQSVKTRLVNAITQAATDWFAEVNPGNLMKAQSMMDEMATAIKIKAQPQFEAMGMLLKNITIGGLSPLETSAEKLKNMGLLDAQMYMQLQAMETIQKSSQGGGGAGIGVGLGAGMGAGMGLGNMMAGMFGGTPAQPAPAGATPAASPKTFPEVMGVNEAAEYLGVTVEDVVQLCMSGELKAKKIGSQYRISKAALEAFMSS
ncbi:MAG: SPFH domain-containing protein [Chloroflexota bacterium]